jgi:hypothetical protein
VAVAGAAMELVAGFGRRGYGKEAGWVGLNKAGRLNRSGTSDFVNCMRAGMDDEFATSR